MQQKIKKERKVAESSIMAKEKKMHALLWILTASEKKFYIRLSLVLVHSSI